MVAGPGSQAHCIIMSEVFSAHSRKRPGLRLLRGGWRLLASMRFAIALLGAIALASVIGTVLPQQQPYSVYVGLYGAFWADVLEALGFFHIYQSSWYIAMLAFLVASTSACMARHLPVIVREWQGCKEDIALPALQALGHKHRAALAQTAQAAAQQLGQQLANQGWQVRLQERALATPAGAASSGWMVAARKGRLNRIGYLAGHGAVVLICAGGLLDSNWLLRAHMAWRGKTPYQGSGLVSQVPARHRLGADTPGFRGQLTVAEGARNGAALIAVGDGVVVQDLPFSVELTRFHAEYHPNGVPRLFASDVVLHDPQGGAAQRARIKVNRPLHHRGVTLYQSGFEDGGSRVTLQAVPLDASATPVVLQGQVGQSLPLADGAQPRTLEITGLQVINRQVPGALAAAGNTAEAAAASHGAAHAPAAHALTHWLRQQWGGAHAAPQPLRDIGPSISYRVRDAAGQAVEFHNYMRPVQMDEQLNEPEKEPTNTPANTPANDPANGRTDEPTTEQINRQTNGQTGRLADAAANPHAVPQYLLGVRYSAAQDWRYLRIPADADGSVQEFRRLRSALLDPRQRQQAAQHYAALAAAAQDAALQQQLAQAARRVLERFAGDPAQWPQARLDMQAGKLRSAAVRSFGLAGVAALVENEVPPEQHEQAANALLRVLNGALLQLLQDARQQAGLPPLDMAQPRNQTYMHQAVIALSDAPLYPEPTWFMLKDFTHVQASVLQVARTPGKWVVYAGSVLLVLGVLCMLLVRERRLWVWLTPDAAQAGAAQALLAYSSNRRSHEGAREFAQLRAALLSGDINDNAG